MPRRAWVVPEVAAVHVVPSVEVRMTPLSPMAMKVLPNVVRALKFVVTGDATVVHVVPLVEVRMTPPKPTTTQRPLA